MAFASFFGDRRTASTIPRRRWLATPDGLVFSNPEAVPAEAAVIHSPSLPPDTSRLLDQLVDEDMASERQDGALLPWEQVYELLRSRAYASSIGLLQLPPTVAIVPRLESHGSLTDPHFSISITGWLESNGNASHIEALVGGAVITAGTHGLLPAAVWRLLSALNAFADRDEAQRTPQATRKHWGNVRRLAVEADAAMDSFLVRSIVLTPEKLDMQFRRTDIAGASQDVVYEAGEARGPAALRVGRP